MRRCAVRGQAHRRTYNNRHPAPLTTFQAAFQGSLVREVEVRGPVPGVLFGRQSPGVIRGLSPPWSPGGSQGFVL